MAGNQEARGGRRRFAGTRTERAQERLIRESPCKPETGLLEPDARRREMIALKMLLTIAGVLLMAAAVAIPLYGLWMQIRHAMRKRSMDDGMLLGAGEAEPEPEPIAWRAPLALALVACLPLFVAGSMVIVPSGMGGVRISQTSGTEPGTLYPGLHFVTPLVETVQMFDLRDHLFTAGIVDAGKPGTKNNMTVQSREGLNIGLAVTVRYKLDPNKLAS